MNEHIYLIWLLMSSGVGRMRNANMCDYFGSFKEIYEANDKDLLSAGVALKDLKLFKNKNLEMAKKLYEISQTKKMKITTVYDKDFPEALHYIEPRPIALFIIGDYLAYTKGLNIAIVGTRKCTKYGSDVAYCMGRDLADKGIVVVSGMAEGIDTEALTGAVEGGGIPIAVLGSGADYIYPYSNKDLYYNIIKKGAIISEYLPGANPEKYTFPERNRIISGLSKGVLVVESKQSGGSLITANLALDQGKDLFVVPGPINSLESVGANNLLKRGAKAVQDVYDILEEYVSIENYDILLERSTTPPKQRRADYLKEEKDKQISRAVNENASTSEKILSVLSSEAMSIDELAEVANLSMSQLTSTLLMLEMDEKIISLAGARFKKR